MNSSGPAKSRHCPTGMQITLDDLRRFASTHSLFGPTTLKRAVHRLGFVQADPIRAPARAQDLILRHRVKDYRAGDLERRYARLGIEEDFFIPYGFVTASVQALMHPRPDIRSPWESSRPWPEERTKRAELVLAFVRERGEAHPRQVDAHFAHGRVKNYWGGSSSATTQLLEAMHYRGMLRVVRREDGIRIYAARQSAPPTEDAAERQARLDALVDIAAAIYSPLPLKGLLSMVGHLRFAVPQWRHELKGALKRAKQRLAQACVEGVDWFWPSTEKPAGRERPSFVRLFTPFDPVVRDRTRFELLWGWVYRFEAYTPPHKRKMGYYAMPLLWRDHVIGWGNLAVKDGTLEAEFGYVDGRPPRDRLFRRELEAEMDRVRVFLGL
ncbi:MAG TPA: crosslink repair DNA glycosylase YcaQ family protein [Bryobacteraceae bacterium]|nr:crosslink repair DNA glycosylase YcaQ family protein [Bryobacteraceae bacterium]